MKPGPFDWCSMVEGKANVNPFVKLMLNSFKLSAPNCFHRCPYFGVHQASNITSIKAAVTIFPTGNFKFKVVARNVTYDFLEFLLDFKLT